MHGCKLQTHLKAAVSAEWNTWLIPVEYEPVFEVSSSVFVALQEFPCFNLTLPADAVPLCPVLKGLS